MSTYIVTVGYELKILHFREVEVSASDPAAAKATALQLASSEPHFWCAAQETDGDASPTAILGVLPRR